MASFLTSILSNIIIINIILNTMKHNWHLLENHQKFPYIRKAYFLARSNLCDGKNIIALAERLYKKRMFNWHEN